MKIKVCGMRDGVNVAEVASLGIDYMGFIFYPPSPRDCSGMKEWIPGGLPEGVKGVMVSVNMPEDELFAIVKRYGFDTVQLHGDESPDVCRGLKERGLTVFKALGLHDSKSLKETSRYEGSIDMFVFDTASSKRGGTGKKFDWSLLAEYDGETPFLLSGGIGLEDVAEINRIEHPKFAGVDLNSRFEIAPGVKDAVLVKTFIKEIKI